MSDEVVLPIPVPSDGPDGPGVVMAGDLSDDCLELLLDESMSAHDALMTEISGNSLAAHSIVRLSGARKFNQEDPIEAAAAEMILQKNGA